MSESLIFSQNYITQIGKHHGFKYMYMYKRILKFENI